MIATKGRTNAKAFRQWLTRREQRIGKKYQTALSEAVGADPSDGQWARLYETAVSAGRATQVCDDLRLSADRVRLVDELAELGPQQAGAEKTIRSARRELAKRRPPQPEDDALRASVRDAKVILEHLMVDRAELSKINAENPHLFQRING